MQRLMTLKVYTGNGDVRPRMSDGSLTDSVDTTLDILV